MAVEVDLEQRFDGRLGGAPLLLANSLAGELEMWDEQIPALAPDFRVLRYNQRGHGGSPAPSGSYEVDDLGRDAIALLDRNRIERASFAGNSLGGMVGIWLAINVPERIDRLVLCSTSAHVPPPERWLERATAVRDQGIEVVADATLERWFGPEFHRTRPARVEGFRAALLRTDPGAYAACCEAIARYDLRDGLAAISAPTLVITAADDPSIGPEHGRLLAAQIPGASLLALPAGRHLVNVELPAQVNGPLLEHLTASVPASG